MHIPFKFQHGMQTKWPEQVCILSIFETIHTKAKTRLMAYWQVIFLRGMLIILFRVVFGSNLGGGIISVIRGLQLQVDWVATGMLIRDTSFPLIIKLTPCPIHLE